VPQEPQLGVVEVTLAELHLELVLAQELQDFVEVLFMLLR
jgi:hypothetical protein